MLRIDSRHKLSLCHKNTKPAAARRDVNRVVFGLSLCYNSTSNSGLRP